MNVILIGHRGVGKTSVGTELSRRMVCPLYDSDQILEEETGCTIPQLVERGGWDYFRQKEKEVIAKMTILKNSVIATGGGAVIDADNADILRRIGTIIWLVADVETIVSRLKKDCRARLIRPSLSGNNIYDETALLLAQRNPIYRRLACYTVDTSKKSIDEVVEDIEAYLGASGQKIRKDAGHGG